jgi:hypothetical protein
MQSQKSKQCGNFAGLGIGDIVEIEQMPRFEPEGLLLIGDAPRN